jgi:hypothetical protein
MTHVLYAMGSAVALTLLLWLCGMGIWHQRYRDNALQFSGMAGMGLWAATGLWRVLFAGDALSAVELWALTAIVVYGLGTAIKVLQHPPPERAPARAQPTHGGDHAPRGR